MAPPPEYDKEPKAPDKSATNIPCEESKSLYNLVNEHQNNSEAKTTNSSANAEVENNKHVEALDDGQLRALLDEAITYKCPKDREGKSNLFKELLESVEQDEQACEAAARVAGRARRAGGGRGRRALPHSNSLQDLVAALAAEPAPRRRHAPAPAPVSARALHGGSLPSGVDTSFLLSEEPARGAEYVATVRCVNPAPLAERRVSASDAPDTDPLNRRSKPAFPLTYTARATLEIGGAGPGRAVTSTTASHQVRTAARPPRPARAADQQRLFRAIESDDRPEDELGNGTKPVDARPLKSERLSKSIDAMKEVDVDSASVSGASVTVGAGSTMDRSAGGELAGRNAEVVKIRGTADFKVSGDKCSPAEAPGGASVLLTLYKRLVASPLAADGALDAAPRAPKKKKDKITSRLARKPLDLSDKKKDIIRNALTKLFLDNITQSDSTKLTGKAGAASKVDSAIPFSCITTPEVAAAAPPSAPPDLKPGPESRAGAGLAAPPRRAARDPLKIPRNALTSGFSAHGVPIARPGAAFGAAAAAAAEEFKKSLDENGNSVPGFGSPQAGSGQQKKQRRKKSSKNETVIKSHHIDGYQGNKDLHELLRFIESAEPERAGKRDDKKKRSAERRKDKPPRASSLDALSRAAAPPPAPAEPERRSWGDAARAYLRDPEPDALELTDFQTVTKKRRPRRRADEPSPRARRAPAPPRSPPSPRARSDRSNDSTDDLDSVHSLPALPARAPPAPLAPPAPPPPPLASYADIARTRHNIPDLIESCNYYGEGEPARAEPRPAAPGDALAYPALEARARRARDKPAARPAPDVVADRRPAVELRAAPRAPELDGVTFGFDVNEQLLARRPRCDLLRYLPPAPPPASLRLRQIVDYVAHAWEDVLRCGGGKVRYFSE